MEFRRPNGRLPACNPCNRRKIRCDHSRPVCQRCRKRGSEKDCVYSQGVAAGRLTRQSLSTGAASVSTRLPQSARDPSSSTTPNSAASPDRPRGPQDSSSVSPSNDTSPTSVIARDRRGPNPADARPGFLGWTSFSTVFQELGVPSPSDGEVLVAECETWDRSTFVIRHVPDRKRGWDLFTEPVCAGIWGWVYKIALQIHQSLYECFGHYLEHDTRDDLALARIITKNTSRPIRPSSDSNEYLSQFTGQNLRWESLASPYHLQRFFNRDMDKAAGRPAGYLMPSNKVTRECIGLCIEFSWKVSEGNIFLVYLSHKRTALESMFTGDASLPTWRHHANTVALATFIGVHQASESANEEGTYQPTFLSEAQRRINACLFTMDKVPPMLSRIYTSTPLPLDLRDEDLFADAEGMKEAVGRLDENGWSTDNGLYSATYIRGRAIMAFIRDEIFEIALGNKYVISVQRLLDIKARQAQSVSGLPQATLWRWEELVDPSVDRGHLFTKLILRLEILQNSFFLERLLLRQPSYLDEGELLMTSFEMLSLAVCLWTHMDTFTDFRKDFEWILMGYGAPAGGILCLELLKPTFHRTGNSDITRSAICQKLSLFVGFLGWVKPNAPNANLCENCKLVVQAVLDKSLNDTSGGDEPVFSADIDFHLDPFNFDLLDTFDWLRPGAS